MENQNDISKRHDVIQNDIYSKNLDLQDLFRNPIDQHLYVVVKKIEKIVAALYLVTDVMDEDLPLTESIRKQALQVLVTSYRLIQGFETPKVREIVAAATVLDEMIALVKVGCIAHHISPMNADILLTELQNTGKVFADIAKERRNEESRFMGNRIDITQPVITDQVLTDDAFAKVMDRYESKRHQNDIKTTLIHQNDISKRHGGIKTTFQNPPTGVQATLEKQSEKTTLKTNPFDITKIDRKQDILKVLKAKQVGTMADIKNWVPGVSDKTLQRELGELIEMNLVKREGNKRWAVYKIV